MSSATVDNKVILISGGAGGIGAATARRLITQGARVILADLDEVALDRLAAELGDRVSTVVLDVTSPMSCENAVAFALDRHGRLDIVWANAGISAYGPVELMDGNTWRQVVAVNLIGAYNLVSAALGAIIDQRGYIALTASWASFAHSPGHSAYAAAKAGLEAMANSLRSELAHQQVDVGVFHPGWINTPLVTNKIAHEPAFNALLASLPGPLRRLTAVDELADILVSAIARRSSRVIYPRTGWLLYAARPLLPFKAATGRARGVAAEVCRLVRAEGGRA